MMFLQVKKAPLPYQREYLIWFLGDASRVAVVGKDDVNYWEVF